MIVRSLSLPTPWEDEYLKYESKDWSIGDPKSHCTTDPNRVSPEQRAWHEADGINLYRSGLLHRENALRLIHSPSMLPFKVWQ